MKKETVSKLQLILRSIIGTIFFVAILFIPAGTFNWPEAWILLTSYLLFIAFLVFWLKKNNPGLLAERQQASRKKDVKTWDNIIITAYSILLLIMLALAGLDVKRFGWSKLPFTLEILGFLGFIPAMYLGFRTMVHNSYLSERVRIQEERGHTVCSSGPYRLVRHPMYVAVLLGMLCFPLALGSLYALIPAVLIIFLFILRTAMEDKTLRKELPGYQEYAEKVRYRLFPGIW